jgi:hypothetical protein
MVEISETDKSTKHDQVTSTPLAFEHFLITEITCGLNSDVLPGYLHSRCLVEKITYYINLSIYFFMNSHETYI